MIKLIFPIILFTLTGCSSSQEGLSRAMNGYKIASARNIKSHEGGLREQVDEIFFRADPQELKDVIIKAGFIYDGTVPGHVRSANSSFNDLVGAADKPDSIGYRRGDLSIKAGTYCYLLCSSKYDWAYIIYVDAGKS